MFQFVMPVFDLPDMLDTLDLLQSPSTLCRLSGLSDMKG